MRLTSQDKQAVRMFIWAEARRLKWPADKAEKLIEKANSVMEGETTTVPVPTVSASYRFIGDQMYRYIDTSAEEIIRAGKELMA